MFIYTEFLLIAISIHMSQHKNIPIISDRYSINESFYIKRHAFCFYTEIEIII